MEMEPDLEAKDNAGDTVVIQCIRRQQIELYGFDLSCTHTILSLFQIACNIGLSIDECADPPVYVLCVGKLSVDTLVQAGARIDRKIRFGDGVYTPVMLAAAIGSVPLLELLILAGADVDASIPSSGETLLCVACKYGRAGRQRSLLL